MTSWRPDIGQGSFESFSPLTTLVDSRDADLRQIAQDLGRDATVAGEELVISARSGLNTCVDRRTDPTHTCTRRQVTKLGAGWCRFKHLRRCRCSQRSRRKPGETSKAPWCGAKRQMETGGGQSLSFSPLLSLWHPFQGVWVHQLESDQKACLPNSGQL